MRAAAVGLAHPPVLDDAGLRTLGWEIAERALGCVRDRATDPAARRMLGQTLAYVPSVYAAAGPEEGFRRLARWAALPEVEVKKLVIANLRKARLARKYPEACAQVAERLSEE